MYGVKSFLSTIPASSLVPFSFFSWWWKQAHPMTTRKRFLWKSKQNPTLIIMLLLRNGCWGILTIHPPPLAIAQIIDHFALENWIGDWSLYYHSCIFWLFSTGMDHVNAILYRHKWMTRAHFLDPTLATPSSVVCSEISVSVTLNTNGHCQSSFLVTSLCKSHPISWCDDGDLPLGLVSWWGKKKDHPLYFFSGCIVKTCM